MALAPLLEPAAWQWMNPAGKESNSFRKLPQQTLVAFRFPAL